MIRLLALRSIEGAVLQERVSGASRHTILISEYTIGKEVKPERGRKGSPLMEKGVHRKE